MEKSYVTTSDGHRVLLHGGLTASTAQAILEDRWHPTSTIMQMAPYELFNQNPNLRWDLLQRRHRRAYRARLEVLRQRRPGSSSARPEGAE